MLGNKTNEDFIRIYIPQKKLFVSIVILKTWYQYAESDWTVRIYRKE